MGLFSGPKEIKICALCGREFESRNDLCCKECSKRMSDKEAWCQGYLNYAKDMDLMDYDTWSRLVYDRTPEVEDELDALIAHQDDILNIRDRKYEFTTEMMDEIVRNYQNVSQREMNHFFQCFMHSCVDVSLGCSFNRHFITVNTYNCAFTAVKDIFAVACAKGGVTYYNFFSRDPLLPGSYMVSVVTSEKEGDEDKIDERYEDMKPFMEKYCPNLRYPVMLWNEFNDELDTNGNPVPDIDIHLIMDSMAAGKGPCGLKQLQISKLTSTTQRVLNDYGYITGVQLYNMLFRYCRYNKKLVRFWREQFADRLHMLTGFERDFFLFLVGGVHSGQTVR